MHKLIVNLSVGILTFVIGSIASLLFYGVSPSATKNRTAVYETGTFSTGCHHDVIRPETDGRRLPSQPISGGVLNGKAISLPHPAYPPVAKAAHASGTITVQVTVDENGHVESAYAVGGHPLLLNAAVQAAYQARFPPTQLSGQPVKVMGVLTYKVVAQ